MTNEQIMLRESAVDRFATRFNKAAPEERRIDVEAELAEKSFAVDSLLRSLKRPPHSETIDRPYLIEAADLYIRGASMAEVRMRTGRPLSNVSYQSLINYAAMQAAQAVNREVERDARQETVLTTRPLKETIELLAQSGKVDPSIAIGVLLMTERVDPSRIDEALVARYTASAQRDLRQRIEGLKMGDTPYFHKLAGAPRDGLAARSYQDLVAEMKDRERKDLDSRLAREVSVLYDTPEQPDYEY